MDTALSVTGSTVDSTLQNYAGAVELMGRMVCAEGWGPGGGGGGWFGFRMYQSACGSGGSGRSGGASMLRCLLQAATPFRAFKGTYALVGFV